MMKKIHLLSRLLFVPVFLLASLGITVHKMACLYGCADEISLLKIEDCCGDEQSQEQGVKIQGKCCEISSAGFSLGDYTASLQYQPTPDAVSLLKAENLFIAPVPLHFYSIAFPADFYCICKSSTDILISSGKLSI